MKKILYILVPLILVTISVVKLKRNKEAAKDKIYQYDREKPVFVQVDTIKKETIGTDFVYPGTFEPNKETKLSSEVQGKINEVLVDAGTIVTKGEPLVQLDNSLLKLQLQSAEVQVEGLEADVKRLTILANADAVQAVQLEKAELGLRSAKVQRATLLEQINKTTVRAPFDGIVTSKFTEEGAFAAPGVPLLQITDISSLKFTINVSETDLDLFQLNQSYLIHVDAQNLDLSCKPSLIGSKANIGSSFPVQFVAKNTADLKIKSGMFGRLNLKNESDKSGFIVPASAIVDSHGQPQVYKIEKGKASLRDIMITQKIKNKVVVGKGLEEGDVIVVNGIINLFNNANVIAK